MMRLASFIFSTVTLWILCRTEEIGLLSPIDEIQHTYQTLESNTKKGIDKGKERMDYGILPGILRTDSLPPNEEASLCQNQDSKSSLSEKFADKFAKKILSKDKLSKVYITSLSPEQAAAVYERIVDISCENIHTANPKEVAKTVTSAIRATWANLTLTQHIQSYGYTAADYMIHKNVLTSGNLNNLCDKFVFHVEQTVCNVPKIPDPRYCYIIAAHDGLVHFLISLNIFTADGVNHLSHDWSDATHCLTGVPPPLPEDPCCKENLLQKFVTKFSKTILASDKLSEIFVPYLSPKEAAKVYKRIVYNHMSNILAPCPKKVMTTITDAIQQIYGKLTVSQHVIVCGYSVALFMKSKKVLTCKNLDEICDGFVFYVNQAVSNVPNISDRRYALVQALSNSIVNFLVSVNIYRADTVLSLAQIFAKSFCSITGVSQDIPWPENIEETVLADNSWAGAIIRN